VPLDEKKVKKGQFLVSGTMAVEYGMFESSVAEWEDRLSRELTEKSNNDALYSPLPIQLASWYDTIVLCRRNARGGKGKSGELVPIGAYRRLESKLL